MMYDRGIELRIQGVKLFMYMRYWQDKQYGGYVNTCGETLPGWWSVPKEAHLVKQTVDTHWLGCVHGKKDG